MGRRGGCGWEKSCPGTCSASNQHTDVSEAQRSAAESRLAEARNLLLGRSEQLGILDLHAA
jgi:hypothetical protein